MRRTTITLSAALMLLAIVPATALARHHHRRHHSRVRHARIERFGRDVTGIPTTSSSSDNAGTVQSFSGGKLTIMLSDHSTVSGMVTRDTELECTAPEPSQTMHEDGDTGGGGQSGSDDNQVQGSDDQSSGEDQGDAAEQNENQAEDQNENEAAEQNENQAEDQNENEAAEQNENENEAQNNCSSADLMRGTVVREAALRISSTGNAWKKVELGS